jgi:hypothetical protein
MVPEPHICRPHTTLGDHDGEPAGEEYISAVVRTLAYDSHRAVA